MTSAAIYARYSSDMQSEASIDDQVRLCRQMIEADSMTVVDVYTDYAISGGTLSNRPGMLSLLDAARKGEIDVVVAEALDRISRDQEDIAAIYKRLMHAEIRLVTLAEGEINELHVGLKGTMNALFLKDLALKTRRGLEGRVRQGRSGGGLCYGYDIVDTGGRDGERGLRSINESEAPIVRRILGEYANGKSPRAIAHALNHEGVTGPRGGAWGPSTVSGNAERGTGILNNELYVGRLVWNRLRYIKDPQTGKRQSRPNPPDKWVIEEVPALRIIDDDLWQQVKARQAALRSRKRPARSEAGFWDRRRPRFLLSGLMKCGVCGGGYSKISATLFGCSTARNKATCDNRLNIRRDVLEATILDALRTRLMQPDLVKEFADAFIAETNELTNQASADRDAKLSELSRIDRKIKSLVTAITEGAPPKALVSKLHDMETRKELIEKNLATDPTPDKPLLHPNMAEIYRKKVDGLHLLLSAPESRDEAIEAIRSLIDRIVLTPDNGQLRIDLEGELAAILRLCHGTKKPAFKSEDGLDAQIKLVAGARCQRYLQLHEVWL